jgi:DNA-directed RNA polymerase specialized sigma24 family protein
MHPYRPVVPSSYVEGAMLNETDPQAATSGFDAFYRAHYRTAVRLAYLLCGSAIAAEDIA